MENAPFAFLVKCFADGRQAQQRASCFLASNKDSSWSLWFFRKPFAESSPGSCVHANQGFVNRKLLEVGVILFPNTGAVILMLMRHDHHVDSVIGYLPSVINDIADRFIVQLGEAFAQIAKGHERML